MPDDHSKLAPLLPIPNRKVKRLRADDSADSRVKVGHRQALTAQYALQLNRVEGRFCVWGTENRIRIPHSIMRSQIRLPPLHNRNPFGVVELHSLHASDSCSFTYGRSAAIRRNSEVLGNPFFSTFQDIGCFFNQSGYPCTQAMRRAHRFFIVAAFFE